MWCLSHAHQTGHTGFRMIITSFLQRVHGKRGLFRDGCTGPKGDA
ncbi:DUF7848 domain-containing protein [Streptomyces rhizosphaericus]